MGIETRVKVLVTAKMESLEDLYQFERGDLADDRVRRIEVEDALVDTGATMVSMPKRLIEQLGLRPLRTGKARTAGGVVTFQIYNAIRLTIQGRDCLSDVSEVPDECPVLIGQVPMELLDFVVDLRNHRLIGNPEHGGEHMFDLY